MSRWTLTLTLLMSVLCAQNALATVKSGVVLATAQGVKCDGVTDDTAAMIKAIATAAAASDTLTLPAGACLVTGLGTIPVNTHIVGQGRQQTTLWETSGTATLFNVANQNFEIEELRIVAAVTRTNSAITFDLYQAGLANIHNIDINQMGINFKTEPQATQVQLTVDNATLTETVLNGADFDFSQCFICSISNTNAFHNPAARPWAELILRNVQGQLQLINDNFDQANQGMVMMPGSGQVVTLIKANMLYLDSNPGGALNCSPTGSGIVQRVMIQNSWLTDGGGVAVTCSGGGSTIVDQISFDNTEFVTPSNGNQMNFSNVTNLSITNNRFGPVPAANVTLSLNNINNCNVTGNLLLGNLGVALTGATDFCNVHDNMNAYVVTPVATSASGSHNRISNP